MKILIVADEACKSIWDFYDETKLQGLDLILSCGDLPPEYLSFLVTMANCPLYYVHGNHDTKYEQRPPEGCVCIDDKLVEFNGLRILGLGGSYRYSYGDHQYTEKEMRKRFSRLRPQIFLRRGFDILLTHAPALGINDQYDLPHRGFYTFLDVLDKYEPTYMIHGHVHMNYGRDIPRLTQYHSTTVINGFEKYTLELPG